MDLYTKFMSGHNRVQIFPGTKGIQYNFKTILENQIWKKKHEEIMYRQRQAQNIT